MLLFILSLLLFLPSSIAYTISNSGYSISDLEMTTTTEFAAEAAEWTLSPLETSSTPKYSDACGVLLLGGYLILQNNGYYQRQYTGLPSHTSITISIRFWFIDRWAPNDKVNMKIWNSVTGAVSFNQDSIEVDQGQQNWLPSICGYSSGSSPDLPSALFIMKVAHTGSVLDIQIQNYVAVSGINRGTNGLRNVNIELLQTTVTTPSFCTNGPVNSIMSAYGCGCAAHMFKGTPDFTCTTCHADCGACYGPTSNDCYDCAAGVTCTPYHTTSPTSPSTPTTPTAPTTPSTGGSGSTIPLEIEETTVGKASSAANKATNIGLMALSLASLSNPAAILMGILAKLFSYIRYLSILYPTRLEEALQNWSSDFITIDFGIDMPESLADESEYRELPGKFALYEVAPRFLVNFWTELFPLAVVIGVFLLFFLTERFLLYRKVKARYFFLFKRVRLASQNFLFTFFYDSFGDFIFYAILEYRSLEEIPSMTKLSIGISGLFIILAVFLATVHLVTLIKQEKIRRKPTATKTSQPLEANENIEILFSEFKDQTFAHQGFPLFMLIRNIIFNVILVTLFEYPLLQTSLLLGVNLLMYIYLVLKRPLKELLDNIQQLIAELILIIVNVSVLAMAILDKQGKIAIETRNTLGDLIIGLNIAFNILVTVILLIRIFLAIREFWLARKEKRTIKIKHSNSQQVILLNQSNSDTFQHLSATIDCKQNETIELKNLNEQSEMNITGTMSPKKTILLENSIEEESPKAKIEAAKTETPDIEAVDLSKQKEKAKGGTPEKQEPLMKRVKKDQSKEKYKEDPLKMSSQNKAPIRLKLPTRTTPMFKDSKKNNAIVHPLNNNKGFEIGESPGVDYVHIQGEGMEVSKDKTTEKDVVSIVLPNETLGKMSGSPKLTKSILKK